MEANPKLEYGKTIMPQTLEQLGMETEDQKTAKFINNLASNIYSDNAKKGFWENKNKKLETIITNCNDPALKSTLERLQRDISKPNVGEKLMLICSEIGEGIEAHRKDKMDDHLPSRKGLEVELADALIRILDLASGLSLDIGGAVMDKLEYNRNREYLHGKKY